MKSRILVFVPMYNCAPQIPRVLRQLDERVRRVVDTVLVVDNRSNDASAEIAARGIQELAGIRALVVRNRENYGLGGSHKAAFAYALDNNYSHVITLHGDDQGSIDDALPQLEAGEHDRHDCLLGARFHPASRLDGYSLVRRLGNHAFNALFSLATGRAWLHDLGSGLNVYRTEMLRDRFYQRFADDLTFNYYMILATVYRGMDFRFFPLTWREDDQLSNVKLMRQARRTLRMLLDYVRSPDAFLAAEHRLNPRSEYSFDVIASNT